MTGHPQDLSLREQARLLADGAIDAQQLLTLTLDRIAESDAPFNSTPVVFPDESSAMADEAPRGPLYGLPFTLKDMFALPWRAARDGTPYELFPAGASGPFRRLRDAGAVVAGIANQDELGLGSTGRLSAYGPARNPHDVGRCTGGSSSGSAAAVAARLVAASLGSDSGGSTRIPASFCGVIGLKITYRGCPYDGYFGSCSTFSAPGVFARDSADARLVAEALLDRPLPVGDGSRFRVGVVRNPFFTDADPNVAAACERAIQASGWVLDDVEIDLFEWCVPATLGRLMAEFAAVVNPDVVASLSPYTRALFCSGLLVPASAVPAADRVRAAIRRSMAALFDQVDLLAWPTTPTVAPAFEDDHLDLPSGPTPIDVGNIRHNSIANLCGVPGISVPAGAVGGLPVGLELLAPWSAEASLLDAATHLTESIA